MANDDRYYNYYNNNNNNNNNDQNDDVNNNNNNNNYYAADSEDGEFWESEEGINKYFAIFLTLLSLVLVLSKLLHDRPKLASILPEAGMTIIVGTIAGAIIFMLNPDSDEDDAGSVNQFVAEGLLSFSPKVFFFVLLPPIIFNSGYNLKRELFFRHIAPISLFAVVGTLISTFAVAIMLQAVKKMGWMGDFDPRFIELLTFGALISATDPVSTLAVFQAKQVDPQLFYLVFGESVLNDAVGLVLFKTFSKFVGKQDTFEEVLSSILEFFVDFAVGFIGSMVVGFAAGLFSAYFLLKVDMRKTPMLELCLFFLIMYLPFFFAEVFELSGIVTILFTGIFARRYATVNLSDSTEENVDILFRFIAHIAETSIFLELGLSVFGLGASMKWKFVGWAILACLIGRAVNIYPLRAVYNNLLLKSDKDMSPTDRRLHLAESSLSMTPNARKDLKVRNKTAHMLWFSGLRGAVAYACAKTFPNVYGNLPIFVSTTMAIVFFTVFTMGCTTDLALNILEIEMFCDEDKYMEENKTLDKMNYINIFENKYINPYVVRNYSKNYNKDVVEMDNMSAVSDAKSWVNPSSPGVTSKSSYFQNIDDDTSSVHTWRKKNSLYDYGMGSQSMRSFRTESVTTSVAGVIL